MVSTCVSLGLKQDLKSYKSTFPQSQKQKITHAPLMGHHHHITRYFFCFYPLAFSCFLLFLFIYISLLVMVILYSVLLFF